MEPEQPPVQNEQVTRILTPFTEILGLSRATAVAATLLIVAVLAFTIFWFFYSAPPKVLTITGGPAGSTFESNAVKYAEILAREGVKLKILPSEGSQQNLQRLLSRSFRVDVGFVQGGVTNGLSGSRLVSLGSISFEPLLVFYRGDAPVEMLSQLAGKRLAIGPEGSGTRTLVLTLLELNGITNHIDTSTTLLDLDAGEAAKALLDGKVDAVFLMGDSASSQVMRQLLHTPEIHLLDFTQADGYTRRISYLNKLELPMGSIDFGKNIPARDVHLIGPTVELVARPNLHPALSDLLLEAAREVNGTASLLKRKGEFPAALEHDLPISVDADRFYKSGKSFLYRSLPFWLASLVNRILVAFVPVILLLLPGLQLIPAFFKWRMRMLIYRRYRALLTIERDLLAQPASRRRDELLSRLDQIEIGVNKMKIPASFADQFFNLRGHIGFVRGRLLADQPAP